MSKAAAAESSEQKPRSSMSPRQLAQYFCLAKLIVPDGCRDPDKFMESLQRVRKGAMHLHRVRQARTRELSSLGWSVRDQDAAALSQRCPPLLVKAWPKARPCRLVRICPFCWARYVAGDLYSRVNAVLLHTPADAIEAVSRVIVPQSSSEDLSGYIGKLAKSLGAFRRALHERNTGAFSAATIEPAEDGWLITRRLLIMVSPEFELSLPAGSANETYVRWCCNQGSGYLHELPKIVGRVTEYPAGMLLGDCSAVLDILLAASLGRGISPRLSRTYGLLRNRTAQINLRQMTKKKRWKN